jgi:hypothetical protein
LDKHVVRVSLANFLNPLYLFVVLDLLGVRRILNLPELRPQIIQYILNLARCTFDVLVELASFFNGCDCNIGSSE